MKYFMLILFALLTSFAKGQNKATEAYNQGISNYKAGNYEMAVKNFTTLMEMVDEPSVQKRSFINRGLSYDRLQKYDLAIFDFTQAIKLDSTDMASFIDRGLSKMHSGALDEARVDFNYVIWKNLDERMRQNAIYWLARINYNQGKYSEVIKYCDQYLASNPDDAELYFIRGTANDMLREFDAAITDYGKAIDLKPDYYQAYANRGTAKINLLTGNGNIQPKKRQTKSACKDLRRAKELGDTAVDDLLFVYCDNK